MSTMNMPGQSALKKGDLMQRPGMMLLVQLATTRDAIPANPLPKRINHMRPPAPKDIHGSCETLPPPPSPHSPN